MLAMQASRGPFKQAVQELTDTQTGALNFWEG